MAPPPATPPRTTRDTPVRVLAPPPAPELPPPSPVTVPTEADLPDIDQLFDQATRDAARRQAEQIYGREDAGPSVRAQAALIVALAHSEAQQYGMAQQWANRALVMNERDVPGARRDARAGRIRNLLSTLPQTPDTTGL